MKLPTRILTGTLAVALMLGNTQAFAMRMPMPMKDDAELAALAQESIEQYDAAARALEQPAEQIKDPQRFVNDMRLEQKAALDQIDARIAAAKKRGERLYTYDEILAMRPGDLGLSAADLQRIQGSVKASVPEAQRLRAELVRQGKARHPLTVGLSRALDLRFPASMIYVDKTNDCADGVISGGGWPYCLDNNGWGYRNFTNSDCFWSVFWWPNCRLDIIGGVMNYYNIRYCKAYVRNCSPLIGHSKYWHRH